MLSRVPHLDLVVGTRALDRIPAHLASILKGSGPIIDTEDGPPPEPAALSHEPAPIGHEGIEEGAVYPVFVSITRGCNNRCAYCVVPRVRGPLESLPSVKILDRAKQLADSGYKEITLIGQNVNVYKEDSMDFSDLLTKVHDVPGLERIRFVTSHPKDLSDRIIDAAASLPKVCEYFHIPLQAGSDKILKLMRRGYTSAQYIDLVGKIRDRVKSPSNSGDVAISTDLIVGFPGETDEDFEDTMKCVRTLNLDAAFMFIYSAREGVEAETLPDKVPREVKSERIQELNKVQTEISRQVNLKHVAKIEEVLIEVLPRSNDTDATKELKSLKARTRNNKIVYVQPPLDSRTFQVGDIVSVVIEEARAYAMFGRLQDENSENNSRKV